jgi:mycofactocin precursor
MTMADEPNTDTESAPEEQLVTEDVLVEEVSIDGMCGVY